MEKSCKFKMFKVASTKFLILSQKADGYSEWSKWGRCKKRCLQRRSRRCMKPEVCGTSLLREERDCTGHRCNPEKATNATAQPQRRHKKKPKPDAFRVLFHVTPFSDWSEWDACDAATCVTRRRRACNRRDICGDKVVEESALCMTKGSRCGRIFGSQKKWKKSAGSTEQGIAVGHPLYSQECGVAPLASDIQLRIIGGREASRGSWPWQLTILNRHRAPICGATLIHPQWAITAAHCVPAAHSVRSGEHDLMTSEGTEQESRVRRAYVHPEYDASTVKNDIALLQLRKELTLDEYTRVACLPAGGEEVVVNERATILGWGKRSSTSVYGTDHLHQAEVPIVDPADCRKSYPTHPPTNRMVCAGYEQGRVDSCAGDSGGPLLAQRNGRWTLFGVTSFGDGCGERGKYGIYSYVPKFAKWIHRTVERHST